MTTPLNLQSSVDSRFAPLPLSNDPSHPPLSPHQLSCCAHACRILRDRRCVFLCEPTGTGKSFIASKLALTALSQSLCRSVCIVAPAHLRSMWKHVTSRFDLTCPFISYQMASLNNLPTHPSNALILVDEAHYLKNPATQRYENLRAFFHTNYLCLITATPVSLGLNDLSALMSFCGFPATLSHNPDLLRMFALALMPSAYTTPLQSDTHPEISRISIPYALPPSHALSHLSAQLAQTQWPVFSTDSASSTHLISQILIHRFLSHPASCRASLRRLQRYYAHCTKTGALRPVSRAEFKHIFGLDGVQLPLPFGLPNDNPPSRDTILQLDHIRALLSHIIHDLNQTLGTDDPKLSALISVVRSTPGKLLLFTQYADTARYVARALNTLEPTALLTSSEATLRSLKIDRDFLQNLFDPDFPIPKQWLDAALPIPRILVATDTLSTGHNLQRASSVIHLDSPWNPTIIKQREGRILRNHQSAPHLRFFSFQLLNATPELLNADLIFQKKLSARTLIQSSWTDNIPSPVNPITLFSPAPDIPSLWLLAQNVWLPVHPRFAPVTHAFPVPSLASTLLTQQHPSANTLRTLSSSIKQSRHHRNLPSLLSNLEHFSFLTALWPQLASLSPNTLSRLSDFPIPNALFQTAFISHNPT